MQGPGTQPRPKVTGIPGGFFSSSMSSKTHEGQTDSVSSYWRTQHGKRPHCQESLRKPTKSKIKLTCNEALLQLVRPQNTSFKGTKKDEYDVECT